eukprot:gene29287-36310_t
MSPAGSGLKHLACELSPLVNGKKVKKLFERPHQYVDNVEESFVDKLRCLESLKMVNISLSEALFVTLLETCRSLRDLTLTNQRQITQQSLMRIATMWSELTEISLVTCAHIDDAVVTSIAERSTKLTLLDISHSYSVHDDGVRAILAHCVHLREFDEMGVVEVFQAHRESLRELHITQKTLPYYYKGTS